MAFKDAVTEMALLALLWETTLRPSLQMWKLRLSRVARGILNMVVVGSGGGGDDSWTWKTGCDCLPDASVGSWGSPVLLTHSCPSY